MRTTTKFLPAFKAALAGRVLHRPALALQGLADKAWGGAWPIVAKGCLAAMVQPSPTAGFLLGVTLEIGRRLSARTCSLQALNDDMEMHHEHAEQ